MRHMYIRYQVTITGYIQCVSYTMLFMSGPDTDFDWVTITEFDRISIIWNSHCACAVLRDLSPGGGQK